MNKLFPIVFALLFLSCDEDNIFYFEGPEGQPNWTECAE